LLYFKNSICGFIVLEKYVLLQFFKPVIQIVLLLTWLLWWSRNHHPINCLLLNKWKSNTHRSESNDCTPK